MKKILFSIATIAVVGALGFAATNAFFTDTETSTGNTFTAGTLDLNIGSECHYYKDGVSVACPTGSNWTLKNKLITGDKFFNFTDIKPGDYGENTITFKVLTNPAWMCANMNITQNSTLGKYLNLFWWIDSNGNNVYETGEKVLYGGPLTIDGWLALTGVIIPGQIGALPLTFADSYMNWITWPTTPGNTTPIPGDANQYLGVGWCFGNITLTGTGTTGFTCSGTGNQQDSQGQSVVGDLTFSVEQSRNQPGYRCPENVDKPLR